MQTPTEQTNMILDANFSWHRYRCRLTDRKNPTRGPLYNIDITAWPWENQIRMQFLTGDANGVFGSSVIPMISINPRYTVHSRKGTLKAMKRFSSRYTFLSYARARELSVAEAAAEQQMQNEDEGGHSTSLVLEQNRTEIEHRHSHSSGSNGTGTSVFDSVSSTSTSLASPAEVTTTAAVHDHPVEMSWQGNYGLKECRFTCLDENQLPVARLTCNLLALKKWGSIEFLGDMSKDLREEIIVMAASLYMCLGYRCSNPFPLIGALFARPGPIKYEKGER